ncbi:MAG: BatA and WFA domain-containing protein [Phycisphaerae bacterium]|nr:BatA domain-containing protein [Phycisphaerae bacterium]MCZ2399781.1 BatA and WFA domain-containing protein [Phycisphaerae bacterium]
MGFLNPWVALAIAGAVIPALLILYFLKLRRKQQVVPSTLLWRRAVRDMQVNAPFQRLRKNLLLLLQLLVLAAALLALARPVVKSDLADEKSLILLIDRSGSMNALEDGRTRLDLAKEQAVGIVRSLNRTGAGWFNFGGVQDLTRVMVIAFSDRATIVSPFTTNTGELPGLIEKITPTDNATNLREAMDLADAYMAQTRVEQRPGQNEQASKVVLISDGAVSDLESLTLRAAAMEWIRIGDAQDNVGITAMRVERNYERPEEVSVFVGVQNFGPGPVRLDLSLYLGQTPAELRLGGVQALELGPKPRRRSTGAGGPEDAGDAAGTAMATFDLVLPRAAVVEARLSRDDALALDNRAFAVVPPPRKLRLLLVSRRNFFIESVLAGLPLERVDYWTPEQYEAKPDSELAAGGRSLYDVIVLDKHDTARLPEGNYFFIGSMPKGADVERAGELQTHTVMWWDETHPILRHVAMEHVIAARGLVAKLPPQTEIIAEGPQGPVLARYGRDGRQFLLLTFAIEDTQWWSRPGFPIFFYNAIRYLGGGAVAERGSLRPGEPVRVPLPPQARTATVRRPDGGAVTVTPDVSGAALFSATTAVGFYEVEPAVAGHERFAINAENPAESDIAPPQEIRVGAIPVQQGQALRTSTPEVWRWFIGAALMIALIEWYIYNRRVMI